MPPQPPPIPWLVPGQDFPPANQAWGENSPAPGLLAGGGVLDVDTLRRAYSQGIFPWYSEGQPTLWWSPNPRMVLDVSQFRVHSSFRKALEKFRNTPGREIRMDSAFEQVIQACSTSPREGQSGTWIVPDMIAAYGKLHEAGFAHSVETWINGTLVGGLYCVALGKSVFGESMFSYSTDASKIALAALVSFCRHHGIRQIDCQQNTRHLASLGAREISRDLFVTQTATDLVQAAPVWEFDPLYWRELLPLKATQT
ncbi:MAG: leucyl/phenylalanyl-tRNA--protein transferase [Rhodoferax sp.]|nr:leucyl/phenylalanyl-tRNA--protein transferase [Rhodoferax sp.]